ncbi:MAG: hypothetical protein H6745_31470 [Deltaproteobacteria bacterium]|nr:hypothetical protein [Deltaproteobacteria bacterium]
MRDGDPKNEDRAWADPGDDAAELAAARHLARYLDGDAAAGGRPTAEDLEVIGIFGELAGGEPLPRSAWDRIGSAAPQRRRAGPRAALLALAAALILGAGAWLWLSGRGGDLALPPPTSAELTAFGEALRPAAGTPADRARALDTQAQAQLARVVAHWESDRAL